MSVIELNSSQAAAAIQRQQRSAARNFEKMQDERDWLFKHAPTVNATLLFLNMFCCGMFFYLLTKSADLSTIFPNPYVGAVVEEITAWAFAALGAAMLFLANAIAAKLPEMTGWNFFMMLCVAIALTVASIATSAFFVVFSGESAAGQGRVVDAQAAQAGHVVEIERRALERAEQTASTLNLQLAAARNERAQAVIAQDRATAELTAWRARVEERWGIGSGPMNQRMQPTHPEHAPLLAAIESANQRAARAEATFTAAFAAQQEAEAAVQARSDIMRDAMQAQHDAANAPNPWDKAMASMGGYLMMDGPAFLAGFAMFLSIVASIVTPLWSYSISSSVEPQLRKERAHAKRIQQVSLDIASDSTAPPAAGRAAARKGLSALFGGGPKAAPTSLTPAMAEPPSATVASGGAPIAEAGGGDISFEQFATEAMGRADPMLPCKLTQSRYEELKSRNVVKIDSILRDAGMNGVEGGSIGALKKQYNCNDETAAMLKQVLAENGHADFRDNGSIELREHAKAADPALAS